MIDSRKCGKCRTTKPLADFTRSDDDLTLARSHYWCKECTALWARVRGAWKGVKSRCPMCGRAAVPLRGVNRTFRKHNDPRLGGKGGYSWKRRCGASERTLKAVNNILALQASHFGILPPTPPVDKPKDKPKDKEDKAK